MKVYLHEISEEDLVIEADEKNEWLTKVFDESDEDFIPILNTLPKKSKAPRPVKFNVNLRKVDEIYVVNGDVHSHLDLLCSRCATPFVFRVDEHFSNIYSQDKQMAGIAYLDKNLKPKGQNMGFARHAASIPSETKLKESTDDLEMTYIAEDHIDLADLLREVISLRLPYQPLCKEDCKGVCTQCGTDLNHGRCACAKVVKQNAFSVLQNIADVLKTKKEDSHE